MVLRLCSKTGAKEWTDLDDTEGLRGDKLEGVYDFKGLFEQWTKEHYKSSDDERKPVVLMILLIDSRICY